MRLLATLAPVVLVVALCAAPVRGEDAWTLDIAGVSYDEECLIYALQGLVNRDVPRLFLDTRALFWQYRPADQFWMGYLAEKKGHRFIPLEGLGPAIAHFRQQVKGVVLYDPGRDASRYVALTLAGLRDLLPVTEAILRRETPALRGVHGWTEDCFRGMPVVEDLRGRFADDASAYRWALDHLMPECVRNLAFNAGHSHGDTWLGSDPANTIGLDYPIARKAFIFNLSPADASWHERAKPHRGHPEQTALFDEVMRRLDRPAGIYGWAEPEETYCARVSQAGNFIVRAGAPNLSFWAKVPVAEPPRLPPSPLVGRPLEMKCYVIFQANDGDAPRSLAGLMSGAWVSAKRGSVPIAWGINPYLAERFPALVEFYGATAKPGDSFFAARSGAGYCLPWLLPNLDDYARQVGRCLAACGPNVVHVCATDVRLDQYERYRKLVPAACFTQQAPGLAVNEWLDDGTPIIAIDRRLFNYDPGGENAAERVQEWIEAVAAAREPPFFILCYGGVGPGFPDFVAEVRRRLHADRFEVIGAQELANLARRAGEITLRTDAPGVSVGGTVNLEVVLRNPDGLSGGPGQISWGLPEGWRAAEPAWQHGPVPRGTALRHVTALTAGTTLGRAHLTCIDDRTGGGRSVTVDVYSETLPVSDFSSAEGWRETGATLAVADGRGRITTPAPYASIRRSLTLDFDRSPVLDIRVTQVGGLWALKANDGTLAEDLWLQLHTAETGRFLYDLAGLNGWSGRKSFELILYAVGEKTSFEVDDIRVHYRK